MLQIIHEQIFWQVYSEYIGESVCYLQTFNTLIITETIIPLRCEQDHSQTFGNHRDSLLRYPMHMFL